MAKFADAIEDTPEEAENMKLRSTLMMAIPIAVDDAVIAQTIRLRQMRKIKIPDAIIAASALIKGLPLVTNNWGRVGDLGRVDHALNELLAIFDG